MIDKPGKYNISFEEYLADPCPEPSLTRSTIKSLISETPRRAFLNHPRLNPQMTEERSEKFDIGTAAHAIFLQGYDVVHVVDASDWRTNAAKNIRDEARKAGKVPLLSATYSDVMAMVTAAHEALTAWEGRGLRITDGHSESTFVWKESNGVWCRIRPDWIFTNTCIDYKTTGQSADPQEYNRIAIANGHDIQDAFYRRGIKAIEGEEPDFIFMVQETEPPYLCAFHSLDMMTKDMGEQKVEAGIGLWESIYEPDSGPDTGTGHIAWRPRRGRWRNGRFGNFRSEGKMGYEFKKAVREEVGLLIGLIGPSGSGKTFSAMRIAAGIVGEGNRFAVIDTENRRALHYASQFAFDHCELSPPFKSLNYAEAIKAADTAGYKAIVVDSCSHEWASEGGVLDFQEQELTRMAGDDYKKREACKMAAWIKPKSLHKQMVQRLLQTKAHLILCFRAEEKTKIEKGPDGKTHIIPMGFQPVCSKELPYELTVSFLLSSDHPGIGQPIKLQEQHKTIFPTGKLLDESSGKSASEWAKGGIKAPAAAGAQKPATPSEYPEFDKSEGQKLATADQVKLIQIKMRERGITERDAILSDLMGFCARPIHSSKDLTFDEAHDFIQANSEEAAA